MSLSLEFEPKGSHVSSPTTIHYMEEYNELLVKLIRDCDNQLARIIQSPSIRYRDYIDLIASESLPTPAVLAALSSAWHNQTIEGAPGSRYFPGTQVIDAVEELGNSRARELFGYDYSNIQPHSATQANQAALLGTLHGGDRILSMSIYSGGHLSHGNLSSLAGRMFEVTNYDVREDTGLLDYDEIRDLALQNKPKLIVSGASAYPRKIDFEKISEIASEVDALHLADISHIAGFIAAGIFPSIKGTADIVTSSFQKTLSGPRGGVILTKDKLSKKISRALFPGVQGAVLPNVIVAKTVALGAALTDKFRMRQSDILANSKIFSDCLADRGWSVITKGTDTHIVLAVPPDPRIGGSEAERRLQLGGVLANRNFVPSDRHKNRGPSGIRFGMTVVTSLGLVESDMPVAADLATAAVMATGGTKLESLRREAKELMNFRLKSSESTRRS